MSAASFVTTSQDWTEVLPEQSLGSDFAGWHPAPEAELLLVDLSDDSVGLKQLRDETLHAGAPLLG